MDNGVVLTTTNKGGPALIVDGYIYRQDRVHKATKTWRCTENKCPARCKTNLENDNIEFSNAHRDHPVKTDREIAVAKFRKNCRKRGGDDLFDRPSKVMRLELNASNADQHVNVREMERVRKAIYNERRKTLPKLPKNRAETHQSVQQFGMTSTNGENMLLKNDVDSGLIVFSTATNLQLLCERDVEVLGDGTFKTCPRYFYQMYVLHAYKRGLYVPCIFCLLPSKIQNVYNDMFRCIRELCTEYGLNLDLRSIHLDFELAVIRAVKEIWPQVEIRGCLFHLSQAWYRKIQSIGLADEYTNLESEIGRWLKRFFGLSFLTHVEVEDSLAFDIMDDAPDDERCTRFCDYVLNTYASNQATFAPAMWADSSIDSIRTTNGCESFHSHFSGHFYHAHPNIFDFMTKIKGVQSSSYIKLNSLRTGMGIPAVRPRRRQKLAEMLRIKERYDEGELTRKEYVSQMAWKNLPVVLRR